MADDQEEEHQLCHDEIITLGGVDIPLVGINNVNDTSRVVKPLIPKEQWASLTPEARRKVFDSAKRTILDDKFAMVTIVGSNLEALEDTVSIQEKIEHVHHHMEVNYLTSIFDIIKYDEDNLRAFQFHSTVNLLKQLTMVQPKTVVKSNTFI